MIHKLIIIILALFLSRSIAFSYSTSPRKAIVRQVEATRVNNQDGWDIPMIKQNSKVKKVKTERVTYPETPSFTVERTIYQPQKPKKKKDLNLQKLPFFTINGQELHIEQAQLMVTKIVRYSVGGKIFCYHVVASHLDGTPYEIYLGEEYSFFFFDTDGDGKFETLEYALGFMRNQIPKWVLPSE